MKLLRGLVADGYWPDGHFRPWRSVVVLNRAGGSFVRIRYVDDESEATVPASSVYSGNAASDASGFRRDILSIPSDYPKRIES